MWQHQEASSAPCVFADNIVIQEQHGSTCHDATMHIWASLWSGTEIYTLHINRHNVHNFLYEPGSVQRPFFLIFQN